MRNATRLTVAAVALLSGISVASAASMSKSTTTGFASPMSTPSDRLSLTSSQQKMAWKDISGQAVKETAPAKFIVKVGAAVPKELGTKPVPVSTANKVPALRTFQYALLDSNKLLIINPTDHKVAEIIKQ
jgi:hypothetical protein